MRSRYGNMQNFVGETMSNLRKSVDENLLKSADDLNDFEVAPQTGQMERPFEDSKARISKEDEEQKSIFLTVKRDLMNAIRKV